jgi:transcription-repair coupling factor (superfamily II helicase)
LFLQFLFEDERYREAAPRLRGGAALYAPSFFASYVLAGLLHRWRESGRLVVAPDGEGAAQLAEELAVYLDEPVAVLPARGVPWGGDVAPAAHICGARQHALLALAQGGVVVAEAAALLERFPPLALQPAPLAVSAGAELPFEDVPRVLAGLGYARVQQVRGRGEFAVRGGIVDVYPSADEPVRLEFWGDEVESLRRFSVFSQRTIAPLERCVVHTAVEVDPERADYQRALQRALDAGPRAPWAAARPGAVRSHDDWGPEESVDSGGEDQAVDDLYRLAGIRATEALSASFVTIAEMAEGSQVAVYAPDDAWHGLADLASQAESLIAASAERERFYVPLAQARELVSGALRVELLQRDQRWHFLAARPQIAVRDVAGAERELTRLVRDDYRTFVVFRHIGEALRAAYRLKGLSATVLEPGPGSPAWQGVSDDAADERPDADQAVAVPPAEPWIGPDEGEGRRLVRKALGRRLPEAPGLYFVAAPLREGFVSAELKLAVLGERSLLRAAPREPRFAGGARLATFFDLRAGDYVVHEDYGVARFVGIETKTVVGVTRDYLFLQFKGDDKVYLPQDQMGKVTRYIGASGAAPALNSLTGTAWQAVKTRAHKAVAEMAGELLQLYATRRATPGFAFQADGELLARLEGDFRYQETDDQAEAIDEVKNDMEATYPMDRLVCGDVGYGKTEVALRATAKAVESGKQVMVLVPTTILAQQHNATFGERFSELPVRVETISRFRTSAETRAVLKEFSAGKVDVLIGTHRLLGKDVAPRDLGLVIVDEEQRFGVRQKELLRQLKQQVDVMSLSATPIPRTLQMGLTGIRDISVIETPPRGRHEIRTYIGEYRDDVARIAIEKEIARKGQVFFLHNRVETIDQAAEHVRQLVPAARVAVAHGQMHEHQLERVMTGFLTGQDDVLVTTSIIESGIDIPSVNTLVVDRADMLGLAQLYQIRGRIGRSDAHAYAYLLYPSEEMLGGDAVARLQTLSDHTELGAGFKIAMRDLEIRGAGNLLGDEQSGHVAAIGFELYAQLLDEAVAELRGQPVEQVKPLRLDIPVTAYVPPEYIAYEATKIDVHRRMARTRDLQELDRLRAELGDRFGAPPEPVEALLRLQAVRIKAAAAGAAAVSYRAGRLAVDGLVLDDASAARLRSAAPRAAYFKAKKSLVAHPPEAAAAAGTPRAAGSAPPASSLLEWVESTLDAILQARTADISQ